MSYFPCIVSKNIVNAENPVSVDITFNSPVDIDGLTINFGENYPKKFSITYYKNSAGQTKNYTSGKALFEAKDSVSNVTSIRITVTEMQWNNTRLRIYNIGFGYGKIFKNEDVISSTLKNYMPLNGSVSQQIDFSVTVKNYDHAFSIENPKSFLNELDTNSTIDVSYGYELPSGAIEWVKGGHLYCSEWGSDNKSATIKATDRMRTLSDEYFTFSPYPNMRVRDLFQEIFQELGISDYTFVDYGIAYNPLIENLVIPPMPYRDVLRLLASMSMCVIKENVNGTIEIVSRYVQKGGGSIEPYNELDWFSSEKSRAESIKFEDMTSYPKLIKGELVKDIKFTVHQYVPINNEDDRETIVDEYISGSSGSAVVLRFEKAFVPSSITVDGGGATITKSGPYFAEISLTRSNPSIKITGIPYWTKDSYEIVNVGSVGKTLTWDNPLMQVNNLTSELTIGSIAKFGFKQYYGKMNDFELNIRGNPEYEIGDKFYQEGEFVNAYVSMIYESTLNFNQSFSQKLKVKVVGEVVV